MSAVSKTTPKTKATPTAILIGLTPPCVEVFTAALKQFSIEVQVVNENAIEALDKKFEVAVIRLKEENEAVIEFVRRSPHNRHIPILGVLDQTKDSTRYSKFGLNALIKEPVERQEAIKAVRGTHLLILHELRRYLRIPIVMEVTMELMGGGKFDGVTRDISYGGMAISTTARVSPDNVGQITAKLPNGKIVRVGATITWRHQPDLLGVRFDSEDPRRRDIRDWIDHYLELF